jgi:hypothetical protein
MEQANKLLQLMINQLLFIHLISFYIFILNFFSKSLIDS